MMQAEMVTKILNWANSARNRDTELCKELWILADAVEDYLPWIRDERYKKIVQDLLSRMKPTDDVLEIKQYLGELWDQNQEESVVLVQDLF